LVFFALLLILRSLNSHVDRVRTVAAIVPCFALWRAWRLPLRSARRTAAIPSKDYLGHSSMASLKSSATTLRSQLARGSL
jgi:hypothetical protein